MPEYSRYETLKIDVGDQVATVTLNRPERLNAVNDQMHRELEDLFGEISSDDAINAIVLTGAGRAFCAGGDIRGMDQRAREGSRRIPLRSAKRLIQNMLEVEQPLISLVNRVVPAGKAYEEALALAKRLAAGPTRAIRWTKLATNKRLKDEVNLVLDASLAVETLSMATEDHKEAAHAFVEKRRPHFTGH